MKAHNYDITELCVVISNPDMPDTIRKDPRSREPCPNIEKWVYLLISSQNRVKSRSMDSTHNGDRDI